MLVSESKISSLYASNSIDDSISTKGSVCVSQEEANGIETHNLTSQPHKVNFY